MTTASEPMTEYRSWAVEEFRAETEPFYVAVSDEIDLFRAAWKATGRTPRGYSTERQGRRVDEF